MSDETKHPDRTPADDSELSDGTLDTIAGGAALIQPCPKCGQLRCICHSSL